MTDENSIEEPLAIEAPKPSSAFVVGEPDSSGTTCSISEASRRSGVSVSTIRRRLKDGAIPGAHKAPGPDGEEWRIPVASLDGLSGEVSSKRTTSDDLGREVDDLRRQLDDERKAREMAEALLEETRRGRDELSRTVDVLRESIETLNRALPPARPEPTIAMAIEQNLRTPTFVGGGEGESSIEQALSNPRGWLARRRAKKNAS